MFEEFSYLAGYIDGDGCIYLGTSLQKPKNILVFEYSLQILSVDIDMLNTFLCYGGFIRKKPKKARHKEAYVWTLKKCKECISNVYPYLIDKKSQAKYFFKLMDSIASTNYQKVPENIINYRRSLISKNRIEKMSQFVTKEKIDSIKNIKPSIKPTKEDFAYLAGFIEAEGTFRVKHWKPKNRPNEIYNISLEIGNTRFLVFPWLMDRFGGNITYVPAKEKRRAVAIWSIQSESLNLIIENIYPFLRTRKKLVCEQLMEFSKTVLPNGGDRHSDSFKERMKSIITKRKSIIENIHILNKKGD